MEITTTSRFDKELDKLNSKYRSLRANYEKEIRNNQGTRG